LALDGSELPAFFTTANCFSEKETPPSPTVVSHWATEAEPDSGLTKTLQGTEKVLPKQDQTRNFL